MHLHENPNAQCLIIGASHAGVTAAFALRKAGWAGKIRLFDGDPNLPYHRPPLSKTGILDELGVHDILLKSKDQYDQQNIELHLGVTVAQINSRSKSISTENGEGFRYDVLIYACGAEALVPNIPGIDHSSIFTLRSFDDVSEIKKAIKIDHAKSAIIIGGGYIGLEVASSLRKSRLAVTLIEREHRLLQRVTCTEVASYFENLHARNGVSIHCSTNVTSIQRSGNIIAVVCEDGIIYEADIVLLGVGISRNIKLAEQAELNLDNGIVIDDQCRSSDPSIYAIGDCTVHYNKRYGIDLRLESVQNANDQAKAAAQNICNVQVAYDPAPWFWSDQYNTKLQTVGISNNYNDLIIRKESEESFSAWYFENENLLAVDAINAPKAYVLAGRIIKKKLSVNKKNLADPSIVFNPANIINSN